MKLFCLGPSGDKVGLSWNKFGACNMVVEILWWILFWCLYEIFLMITPIRGWYWR